MTGFLLHVLHARYGCSGAQILITVSIFTSLLLSQIEVYRVVLEWYVFDWIDMDVSLVACIVLCIHVFLISIRFPTRRRVRISLHAWITINKLGLYQIYILAKQAWIPDQTNIGIESIDRRKTHEAYLQPFYGHILCNYWTAYYYIKRIHIPLTKHFLRVRAHFMLSWRQRLLSNATRPTCKYI
jgi:hypothetical protein